jgi:hypothetical protein
MNKPEAISGGQYVAQLVHHVPMTPKRRRQLEGRRFHNLRSVASELSDVFGIDILNGVTPDEVEFAALMFHRRHVYEHKGGEADEKYIADSGDSSVRPKQAPHETRESAHRIAGLILKIARNVHQGFHEIFPPDEARIQRRQRRQATPNK